MERQIKELDKRISELGANALANDGGGSARDKVPERAGPPESGPSHWVPKRVLNSLEKSKTFEEYRRSRAFRYLHLFLGETDQLSMSLKKAAARSRLEVYTWSHLTENETRRSTWQPLEPMTRSTGQSKKVSWTDLIVDGSHSGFPCGSFSRVRW